jgi:uncharacterized protein
VRKEVNMLFKNLYSLQISDLICKDENYYELVSDILENKNVLSMKNFLQHGTTSCYDHCLNVSYYSYLLCKKLNLDVRSVARAGLLHDLFLYDWHSPSHYKGKVPLDKKHAFYHPYIALKNANKFFKLNKVEKDIIVKHMWPLTIIPPKYKETYIIVLVDKICCITETLQVFLPKKIYI